MQHDRFLPAARRGAVALAGIVVLAAVVATAATSAAPAIQDAPAGQQAAGGVRAEVDFARDVMPLLATTCVACHGGKEPEAGLSFEPFIHEGIGEAGAATAVGTWRKTRDRLRQGEMPPPDQMEADPGQVERALRWLDVRLGTGPGSWPLDPGRVTIRRLNRAEYANTIRDLLDLDIDVARELPADEVGHGFDNNGDVLSLPPLLLEKYVAVAERVAAAALPGDELRTSTLHHFEAEAVQSTLEHSHQRQVASLYSNGSCYVDLELPRAGDYLLRARAWGDQAGPEPCRMALLAGGHEVARLDVAQREDAPETFEARAHLAGGKAHVAVAFLNDYYHPEDADPEQRDRNLIVDWFEFEGPLDPLPPTPSERLLYVCNPSGGDDHRHVRDCAPPVLRRLATRAWRRPATELEIVRLMPFVDRALAQGGSFPSALRDALAAVLVSPNFLFRTELDDHPNDAGRSHDLSGFELASRLSYFLWSSLPDDRLQMLAAQGLLREKAVLIEEAERLLRDPRASALVDDFAAQWLELRSLCNVAPDPLLFPAFDEALREAMRLETEMFFEAILREGRPVSSLLDADFTFLNERLARHYGIAGVTGTRMRRVRLADPRRGGILTQASLLTVTSNPTRTSPVKRGKFLLERVLGAPPPPPPPGVGALDESPEVAQALSLRERLARHRKDPSCAVCHDKMDALGFALEKFDPVGAWRESDGPHAIDDVTRLPNGHALEGPIGLKRVLLEDDRFVRCLGEKLLTYALGRGPTDDDQRAITELVRSYGGRSPALAELITGIVGLDAFRRRRGEAPPGRAGPVRADDGG